MANGSFDRQYFSLLAKRIREGDPEAFAEFYRVTFPLVRSRVSGLLHDPEDIRDAMQEVYMSVYVNIGSLRLDRLLLPWTEQIAYHVCCNMLRQNLRRGGGNACGILRRDAAAPERGGVSAGGV